MGILLIGFPLAKALAKIIMGWRTVTPDLGLAVEGVAGAALFCRSHSCVRARNGVGHCVASLVGRVLQWVDT
jgi:hypothetical protein